VSVFYSFCSPSHLLLLRPDQEHRSHIVPLVKLMRLISRTTPGSTIFLQQPTQRKSRPFPTSPPSPPMAPSILSHCRLPIPFQPSSSLDHANANVALRRMSTRNALVNNAQLPARLTLLLCPPKARVSSSLLRRLARRFHTVRNSPTTHFELMQAVLEVFQQTAGRSVVIP